jgi:type IV pilus assembly protein PilW
MRIEQPQRRFRQGPAAPAPGTAARGFSLIEIMISLTLGLVVIAALGQLYAGTRQATVLSDTMARLDEHGRFAVDFIATDLRMAGYLSCGGPTASLGNAVNGGQAGGSWRYRTGGIEGYDGDATATKAPPSDFTGQFKPGTDILIVRRAAINVERSLINDHATAAKLQLGSKHEIEVGEVLVIANPTCTQTSVFQVTGLANHAKDDSDNFDSIRHDSPTSVQPGNCTGRLFGSFDCNSLDDAYDDSFGPGSVVSRFAVHAYFVTAGNSPALTRKSLGLVNGKVGLITETLIRDVDDFQVLYGRDTVENASLSVDDYVTADRVTDWERIVSVRFMLLLRSPEPNIRTQAASLSYEKLVNADATTSQRISTASSDRRLRRVVGGVVALRNSKYVP